MPDGPLVIFDLDGVIYRGHELMPSSVETVAQLRRYGAAVRFFTNNSGISRRGYVERLTRLGIPTDEDDIMTSAFATALYLQRRGAAGHSVFVVGEAGIRHELERVGLRLVDDPEEESADYVVAGIDRNFSYATLKRAQYAILNGAEFIATNGDATYPVADNRVEPGAGCIVAAIQTATGVEPMLIGKPQTWGVMSLLEQTGASLDQSWLVGDRLDTDIAVGNAAGIRTVLVLTGVSTRDEARNCPAAQRPHHVIETLAELTPLVFGQTG